MAVVNTNIGASVAQAALTRNDKALNLWRTLPAEKSTQQAITQPDWRSPQG